MKALKLTGPGRIELQDVPVPDIGPDEVLIKVVGAGLCHSDLHILHQGEEWPFFGTTMGHETAGLVDAVGADVRDLAVGEPVLVRAVWSCGECRPCTVGRENACSVNGSRNKFPLTPGIGADGGMADYIKARPEHIDRLGAVDVASAAPLADAGLTPMHAIRSVRDRLDDGATVVVIGIGGLGHMAVQILRATTSARIIAVDVDAARLEAALRNGADRAILSGPEAASEILAESDGYGVDAVLDFVGAQATVELATGVVAPEGAVRLVGLAGGSFPFNASLEGEVLPWGANVQRSYGGTPADQAEVLALVADGRIAVDVVMYPLADAQRAFDDLEAGRITGRAILVP
ncbi:Alcohol dehydrogenase (plasmid) [Tsukamurella tyrosinosolvens]|uniref:Alcohol dehydrogenase, propanol-preferring n=1 Tax=Tsukamurella tyrosinosolvens TaxID=57704 RepID=A0A1H5C8E3_TSUTY|nr:NAD(P)-dependent alcohol dehydrogenase [Tsukamurella tyrosinosolvens]KXO92707.1 dehydrogenase [Tsukamurella tyrosinosolvens]SED62885.1 alcohol dehydrogenase, propanol-preferring [Tsukamurella tyrosinosolvens]VEH88593.1 Alcohol dehydrogenase [Tsukamurella tyrosinosolvens]